MTKGQNLSYMPHIYVYVKTFPWDPVHVEFIYAGVCVTKLVSVFTA